MDGNMRPVRQSGGPLTGFAKVSAFYMRLFQNFSFWNSNLRFKGKSGPGFRPI
jgi:hypothetical protein